MCGRKGSPNTAQSPTDVLYGLFLKPELAPTFEEIVEVRFNSSHGRQAVQEVAQIQGQPIIPENNDELQSFNSSHGRGSIHGRSVNGRVIKPRDFASAHGRLQDGSPAPFVKMNTESFGFKTTTGDILHQSLHKKTTGDILHASLHKKQPSGNYEALHTRDIAITAV